MKYEQQNKSPLESEITSMGTVTAIGNKKSPTMLAMPHRRQAKFALAPPSMDPPRSCCPASVELRLHQRLRRHTPFQIWALAFGC